MDSEEIGSSLSIDISLMRDDSVTFNLSTNDRRHSYLQTISRIRDIVTHGGTITGNKHVTFEDEKKPVFLLKIVGTFQGNDVTSEFLVRKRDLYIVAFSTDLVSWILAKCSEITLTGCRSSVSEHIYVGYRSNGAKKECKQFSGRVGPNLILRALEKLHRGKTGDEKQISFKCICVHFAEASRFGIIADHIASTMDSDSSSLLGENEFNISKELYFTNWETMSVAFRTKEWEMENQWEMENFVIEPLARFGVSSIEDASVVLKDLNILLMEDDVKRKQRRERTKQGYRKPLTPIKPVAFKSIKKKRKGLPKIERKGSKGDRGTALRELIKTGGQKDIWRCLARALDCLDTRGGYISDCIINNTDISFKVPNPDLSECYDDRGYEYCIPNEAYSVLTD